MMSIEEESEGVGDMESRACAWSPILIGEFLEDNGCVLVERGNMTKDLGRARIDSCFMREREIY